MSFHAIYEEATGRLVSTTAVAPKAVRAGLAVATLVAEPAADRMWDEATRGYVARPAKADRDRLADLQADSDYQTLTAGNKTKVVALIARYYGDVRGA